ncbi:cytochrome c oxidase subunit II [Myxococcota bacterium]|nr:cytochrome c oxidase subunit II [Myxococcota bacterium]
MEFPRPALPLAALSRTSGFVVGALTAALPVAMYAADASSTQTPSIFDPRSTQTTEILAYSTLVLGICAVIFTVVTALIAYAVIRYRARPGDDGREPAQIYGSNPLELAWTVIPVVVVVILALVTARTIVDLQIDERPEGWMPVTAIGHQWWWEFHYPEFGFTTANELHIPLSDSTSGRPTFLTLESADVIHSFWIPRLAGKMDVIPNRTNHAWIAPLETGTYVGQCAEYCGTQHANMLLRVVVQTPEEFERWARAQQRPAVDDPKVADGRATFLKTACINCHTVRGTVATGRFGPDLTHLMSRATIGAGVATNTPANLRAWVQSPDHLKMGARMPAMGLGETDVDGVVDYLITLH